jgi:hypothetical protein
MRRTHPGLTPRLVGHLLYQLGQTEVGQTGYQVARACASRASYRLAFSSILRKGNRHDHVVRLDVTMEDAALVGVLDGVG